MKLSELLARVNVLNSYDDAEINFITDDSRKALAPGTVFICIKGNNFDGHSVAAEMLEKGAAAVVAERDLGLGKRQVIVENARAAYSLMCAAYFGYPSEKLTLIGITGTNGKTSTSFLIKGILDKFGMKTGLISTIKNIIGDEEEDTDNSTPEPMKLQALFARMLEAGCQYCIMEVTSQALVQMRVEGCSFEAGVFTNLTQDHLDYHGTFENYKKAKAMLFKSCKIAVVNMDDESYKDMIEGFKGRVVTYSKDSDDSSYVAKNINLSPDFTEYELLGTAVIGRIHIGIPGEFTVYNSMAAVVTLVELGFDFHECRRALAESGNIRGRFEMLDTGMDFSLVIDYAHTPDALENIIPAVKRLATGRLITLFGCGGERDSSKRPLMGKVAVELSDYVIVTSDNPRSENPLLIIEDIKKGIPKNISTPVVFIPDREAAIGYAINHAKTGDVILLAGKGHETYQVLAEGKIHFDEREKVKYFLQKRAEAL